MDLKLQKHYRGNIMRIGRVDGVIIACTLLISSFVLNAAQERQAARSPTPESGSETYKEYCAVCHGRAGKGHVRWFRT